VAVWSQIVFWNIFYDLGNLGFDQHTFGTVTYILFMLKHWVICGNPQKWNFHWKKIWHVAFFLVDLSQTKAESCGKWGSQPESNRFLSFHHTV